MNTVLEMKGIVKRYRKRRALDGLDLAVPRGSIFGLVGSNGAGKTTALMIAAGFVKADAGSVHLFGGSCYDPAIHAGRISIVPQDSDLPPDAKVRELVLYYARLQGLRGHEAVQQTESALKWVHLADRMDSSIRSLSHGMRRRVMIAQAFLSDPEFILMDEPLSGLDPREVVNIRDILLKMRGRCTILVSSHNLHEIELICDHVGFIDKGRAVRQDTLSAVKGSVIKYRLSSWKGDLEKMESTMDGLSLSLETTGENGGTSHLLTCSYSDEGYSVEQINEVILQQLLKSGSGILDVSHGDGLEDVYIEESSRP